MIQFTHTNLITDDWRKLAAFYIEVFECSPVYPERDLRGKWLDKATGIENAHLKGIHLALPGYKNNEPTLEIFQYEQNLESLEPRANRKGFGHIAFKADNVEKVVTKLLQNGGSLLGDIVETEVENVGNLTFVYAKDIDGNIVEIQKWRKKTED